MMIRFSIDDSNVVEWNVSIDSSDRLISIPNVISGLTVLGNSCNDLTELNLNRFDNMKRVEIGSNSLKNVKNLTMNGLNQLKSIQIGNEGLIGVERVDIGSNSLNAITSFDFSSMIHVREIEIGHESMNHVVNVTANRLGMLQSIRIDGESLKNTTK